MTSPSPEASGLLAEGLLQEGGRAVEERAAGILVTYLPEPEDPDRATGEIRERLRSRTGLDELEVEWAWQEHGDWAELWRRGLKPRWVTDRLVVTPSWCRPRVRRGERILVLDPGMAFGTAEHATTRGCLRLLERELEAGERLLDVGAGSGILSVAAALLGAGSVLALEGDPYGVEAARDNARRNGVEDRVTVRSEWVTARSLSVVKPRDGVLANLENGILAPLLPGLATAVRPGGWLVLSGILEGEWEALLAAVRAEGLSPSATDAEDGWCAGSFRRPSGRAPTARPGTSEDSGRTTAESLSEPGLPEDQTDPAGQGRGRALVDPPSEPA